MDNNLSDQEYYYLVTVIRQKDLVAFQNFLHQWNQDDRRGALGAILGNIKADPQKQPFIIKCLWEEFFEAFDLLLKDLTTKKESILYQKSGLIHWILVRSFMEDPGETWKNIQIDEILTHPELFRASERSLLSASRPTALEIAFTLRNERVFFRLFQYYDMKMWDQVRPKIENLIQESIHLWHASSERWTKVLLQCEQRWLTEAICEIEPSLPTKFRL